jgi:dTDP-4-dehydrorhamnose reductase
MKLLITGASGFLGRRAATYFSEQGYTVLTPGHKELDITRPEAVLTFCLQHRPDAVLHCAAVSDTGACQREPDRTALINVNGSVNLAKACANIGARFVFCSSDQVYVGSSLPGPHREDEPLTPHTAYACQKKHAEELCQNDCPDTVILRLSWMYSTVSFPGEHGHFLSTLQTAIHDISAPISWPIHDRRGITDVDAVVNHLPAALRLPAGTYNFGAANDWDTYHTIEHVMRRLGREDLLCRLEANTTAFSDAPRDIRMNTEKLQDFGIRFDSTADGLLLALSNSFV